MQNPLRMSVWLGLAVASCVLLIRGAVVGDDSKSAANDEADRRLERMRARAAATTIVATSDEGSPPVAMVTEPIFRYDDQPRRILDATLWAWGDGGRPVAICKVEDYVSNENTRVWVQCLTSLSTQRIKASWEDGRRWSASRRGVELKELSNAPTPGGNPRLRLTQLRRMARRFSATLIDPRSDERQQMRLLPQPMYRYQDAKRGVIDGVIFGLASNGTNPDACFILEIRKSDDGAAVWEYGVAAMTAHAVEVKLDDRTVWTKPFTGTPDGYDNWMFFSVPQE